MKMLMMTAVALLAAGPAMAAGNFDGTWKGDVASAKLPTKPEVELLKDGTYTCSTCVPKIVVAADGAPHPVTGHPYFDAMSVRVVDPNTASLAWLRGGKTVTTAIITVAADGQSETIVSRDTGNAKGLTLDAQTMSKRVGPAPAGAHAISGQWLQTTQGAQVSDAALTFTYASVGDTMMYSAPTGEAYTATIGGPIAPVTGSPGWTGVALKRVGPDTLVETDYRDGKPISVLTMTVMDGGRTMKLANEDKLHGTTSTVMANKQ